MTTKTSESDKVRGMQQLRDLPASKLWGSPMPSDFITGWKDNSQNNWIVLQGYLTKRKRNNTFTKLINNQESPITWAIPEQCVEFLDWHKNLTKLISKNDNKTLVSHVSNWLDDGSLRPNSVIYSLEALSLTYSLSRLASALDDFTWWSLVETLIAIAEQTAALQEDNESSIDEVLARELASAELPLTLAAVLPELKPIDKFLQVARRRLSESIIELTDGEGLIKAELLSISQLLFASWTRSATIGKAINFEAFTNEADTQYEWLIQQMVRLSDHNGRMPFDIIAPHGSLSLYKHAIKLAGDTSDEVAASKRLKGFKSKNNERDQPAPSNNSEWACLATLSAGWSHKSPRFTIDYSRQDLRLELIFENKILLSGSWPVDASCNGVQIQAGKEWEVNCWYIDEDCDYLELSIDLDDGSQLERLILLARQDGIALLGEILVGPKNCEARPISIVSRLSLGDDIEVIKESETRDVTLLANEKVLAGIMPIALPEWRVDKQTGELDSNGKELIFSAESLGRNLASPIWIDFSKTRYAKQRTWRQLTVAQSLEKVANDVAVSYRVQSGKDQWLIYRSLDQRANRTVLGQNFASEAVYGRFLKTGEVDEYLEIGDDD